MPLVVSWRETKHDFYPLHYTPGKRTRFLLRFPKTLIRCLTLRGEVRKQQEEIFKMVSSPFWFVSYSLSFLREETGNEDPFHQ